MRWTNIAYCGIGPRLETRKRADVEVSDKGRRTPLIYASGLGHVERIELLLEKGADIAGRCHDIGPVL